MVLRVLQILVDLSVEVLIIIVVMQILPLHQMIMLVIIEHVLMDSDLNLVMNVKLIIIGMIHLISVFEIPRIAVREHYHHQMYD